MRAVTCTGGELAVAQVDDLEPGPGQLLLQVLRCGICGSDLHARAHCDELADLTSEVGYDDVFRSSDSVVLGHEFCGEIVDRGPRTGSALKSGTRVVSFPLLRREGTVHLTGLSPKAPGGYAEQVLAEQSLTFAVPNGLSTELAALTEPMAVGLHAVRRGEVSRGQVAVVVGCGPVGLAVIGMLKASGVRTVIASDFSAGRRALAGACGADVVVDPAVESPFDTAEEHGHLTRAGQVLDLAVSTMDKLRRLPLVPWERVWQLAEVTGAATPKHPVIFECVGVPGVIDQLITSAPLFSRVVVVGVCMEADRIRPALAINKEIDLRFVLGYTPRDFRDSLHLLADGKVRAEPVLTGTVGFGGVASAFDTLGRADRHAKILIDPTSELTRPAP
ncbi:zinc-binding dehydrogenase [uncultured Jatrophihabitans sp.]|uniref:zinc-binding dehydrogenase n=1 Tax=uncultured Jatrophihabitans sp. TaxID=1610747 RepID=UPI0035C9D2D6